MVISKFIYILYFQILFFIFISNLPDVLPKFTYLTS